MIMKVNIPPPQKKKKREFLSEDLFFSHFIHIDTYFFTIPVEFIYYKKYWITEKKKTMLVHLGLGCWEFPM